MMTLWLLALMLFNGMAVVVSLLFLPGNWIMVITTILFAWWQWDARPFSAPTLVVIALLAFVGEIVEIFAGIGGARRAGAGGRGAIGALLGAMLGAIVGTFAIPIPLIGTLLGACLGAGLLSGLMESRSGKRGDQSIRTGVGAGLGVLIGTTTKIVIGILIWLIIGGAAMWP
jgi:uncharacterized protein YqgC (DUF456 family)